MRKKTDVGFKETAFVTSFVHFPKMTVATANKPNWFVMNNEVVFVTYFIG